MSTDSPASPLVPANRIRSVTPPVRRPPNGRPLAPASAAQGTIGSTMTLTDRLPPAPDPSFDSGALVEAFADWAFEEQGLSLYPAQEEALLELVTGANVILSTPTGSGKSLVAVGAHFARWPQGQRTYYTAPIKALVSEKFFALIEVFGADNVGMMTGDAAVNADAPIICCTAEILANIALRDGRRAPTSARWSWTSSTSTPTPTAAGPGRCR